MTAGQREQTIGRHVELGRRPVVWLSAVAAALLSALPVAAQTDTAVKIGVLDDQSGPYKDHSGPGSVTATRMAIEDFGGSVLGKPIELIVADHQNKPAVGASIARQWLDVDNVTMITGLGNSSIAIAVQAMVHEKGRINMITSGGTHELTGKFCSPNGVHWTLDTYATAKVPTEQLAKLGINSWYFLTADYAAGYAMEEVARAAVTANGGKEVGNIKHPFNTLDFSSYLLRAQQAKPKAIGLANAGNDTLSAIKQAVEFGVPASGIVMAAMYFDIVDVKSLGLDIGKGILFTSGFYWDASDETRAWSKRFMERHHTAPTQPHAGTYGAVTHYLKAVQAAGTTRADVVMAKMREMPVNDFYTKNARLREDGRLSREMYLYEVKAPSESKGTWDVMKLVKTVPGDEAYRPMSEGGCSYLKK